MTQTDVLRIFFGLLAVIVVLAICFAILLYVFQSIGLFVISRRRKLGTSAFAWIPILNWIKFGQIADDAIMNKSGRKTYFKALFPVFYLVGVILMSVGSTIISMSLGSSSELAALIQSQNYDALARLFEQLVYSDGFIIAIVLCVVGYFLTLVAYVIQYYCLYHIYKSCSRKYIVFFVLSLLFSFLYPFFLFAVRRTDNPQWYQIQTETD